MKFLFLFFTIFALTDNLKAQPHNQLVVDISYDVDYQSKPEEISSNVFKLINAQFISIKSLKEFQDFKKGNLVKPFDEIIFSISTHGSMEMIPIAKHAVILKDGSLAIDEIMSMAKEQISEGKKVALLDFSCHSGADIKYLSTVDPKLFCLIAGDSKSQVSYADFRNAFFKKLGESPQLSLEELYLWSRNKKTGSIASPFISTEQGIKTLKELSILEDVISNGSWPIQLRNSIYPLYEWLIEGRLSPEFEHLTADVFSTVNRISSEDDQIEKMYVSLISEIYAKLDSKISVLFKKTLEEISMHGDPFFTLDNYILYQRTGYASDLLATKEESNYFEIKKRIASFESLKNKITKGIGVDGYTSLFGLDFIYYSVADIGILEGNIYRKVYDSLPKDNDSACSSMRFRPKLKP